MSEYRRLQIGELLINDNVLVVIGDNAIGKTRYLKKLAELFRQEGLIVISNLDKGAFKEDMAKRDTILEECSDYLEDLLTKRQVGWYNNYASELLQKITSIGDVLIIDELDNVLARQHLIDFCDALSQLRIHWKKIIVSGYNLLLLRAFTYLEYEEYGSKIERDRVHLVLLENGVKKSIYDRGEAYEHFISLRR